MWWPCVAVAYGAVAVRGVRWWPSVVVAYGGACSCAVAARCALALAVSVRCGPRWWPPAAAAAVLASADVCLSAVAERCRQKRLWQGYKDLTESLTSIERAEEMSSWVGGGDGEKGDEGEKEENQCARLIS